MILPDYQNTDVYDLFLSAVKEMEVASKYRKKKQYLKSKDAIQASANYLIRALLFSNEDYVSNSDIDEGLLASELTLIRSNDQVYKAIVDVIHLEKDINDLSNTKTNGIYNRYSDALVSGRKILVKNLKYNESILKKIKDILSSSKALKRFSYVFLGLLILISLPVGIHHYKEPVHNANLHGELFSNPNDNVLFTSNMSHRFPVKQGVNFREYYIDLNGSADVYFLRVDPVHKKYLAEIEIEWIRLVNSAGIVLQELTSKDFMHWSCENCEILTIDENKIFRIRVTNQDPYIISTAINQKNVDSLIVRMRIISRKTFWEWVFGVDN